MLDVLKTVETAGLHCSVIKKLSDESVVSLVVISEKLAQMGRQAKIVSMGKGEARKYQTNQLNISF